MNFIIFFGLILIFFILMSAFTKPKNRKYRDGDYDSPDIDSSDYSSGGDSGGGGGGGD